MKSFFPKSNKIEKLSSEIRVEEREKHKQYTIFLKQLIKTYISIGLSFFSYLCVDYLSTSISFNLFA